MTLDTNRYSVPAEYAGMPLTLKLYPDHLCLYHQDKLIARHVRCYDRHQDIRESRSSPGLLQHAAGAASRSSSNSCWP